LVANGCLILGAKFEELDMKIPLIVDLQVLSKFKLNYHSLKAIESELLMILDFDLMALTPQHFLSQLFLSGVVFSSDNKTSGKELTEKTLIKLREYSQFFCDAAVEYYDIIMRYPPSKVAAACVYLARKCCRLEKVWDINQEEYTTYKET